MALTDILQSEFSALLPKYVNIETTLPEAGVVWSTTSVSVVDDDNPQLGCATTCK